jgi:uncharacterized membrane protein (DUF4010 family)
METVAPLAVAALAGLAVGLEREWSGHATGPAARFAGLRTFFLLGLVGGVAGLLLAQGLTGPATAILAGGAGLVIAAYVVVGRRPGADPGGTTEAAGLVVLALGTLAGLGYMAIASGTTAVVVLALREKTRLQHLVRHIGEVELRAALEFAVLALVVLPLLPEGPYGPLGGIRPRVLWILVLLFSGLSFVGYLAQKMAGPRLGYPIAGLLGGIVSSTAVTLHFARQSRSQPAAAVPLAAGVLGSCTVLLPRVAIVSGILNPTVAAVLLPFLALPAVVGVALVARALTRRDAPQAAAGDTTRSPLRFGPAVRMALLFQVVLMAMVFIRARFGSPGVIASAALLGLTDMDALVVSMTSMGTAPGTAQLAAQAIAVGILSNTVFKLGIALGVGGGGFRWRAGAGLAALALATGAGLWYLTSTR